MPEPPQLTSFDSTEQRLHSELPLDRSSLLTLSISEGRGPETPWRNIILGMCIQERANSSPGAEGDVWGVFFPRAKELKCLRVAVEVVTDRRFGGSVRGEAGAELIKKEPNYKKEALDFSALTLINAHELFAVTKKRRLGGATSPTYGHLAECSYLWTAS